MEMRICALDFVGFWKGLLGRLSRLETAQFGRQPSEFRHVQAFMCCSGNRLLFTHVDHTGLWTSYAVI
jgi:hypothetical protein